MKPASLRPALLAVAVLLAVRPAWAAVPLKEVTQQKLRDWVSAAVKASRDDQSRAGFWTDLDDLIVVDAERILYTTDANGISLQMVWECKPRRPLDREERIKAKEDLRKVFDHAVRVHERGLLGELDAKVIEDHSTFEIGPNPGSSVVVEVNPEECERLRRELEETRAELDRLRRETSARRAGEGEEPRRYIMVVQPSSMIYYDCASHCWLPGPASVAFYPASSAAAKPRELPRPPAFPTPTPIPTPMPTPIPTPTPMPPRVETKVPPELSLEKKENHPEEAGRVFWVGYRSYWQGDYDRALASFDSAVRLDDQDARFWYYKALAERALGAAEQAEASAKHGRDLHAALKPKADLVGTALERVQGQERRFLNAPEVVNTAAKDGH